MGQRETNSAGSESTVPGRWQQLALLASTVLLGMTLWFSASAITPTLRTSWGLTEGQIAWVTMAVQLGFVLGTLTSALTNLADRLPGHRLVAVSALLGAVLNAAIPLGISDSFGRSPLGFGCVLGLRLLTGAALAGVYPPGMKLMATWFSRGRGMAIGVLVGALTVGSAVPQLLKAVPWEQVQTVAGWEPWRLVMLAASGLSLSSAALCWYGVRQGPLLASSTAFQWTYFFRIWGNRGVRRANLGYLGHMWELYAMWTWVPPFLASVYQTAKWDPSLAHVASFAVIAVGGIGCAVAGLVADRRGRTTVVLISLAVSGTCALVAGSTASWPLWATGICLMWGFSVVADSAQFSAAVTELCDPRLVGTALTIQTCCGFSLTLASIYLVPRLQMWLGGPAATFPVLAVGPALGIWQILRLRWSPEARQLASGNR